MTPRKFHRAARNGTSGPVGVEGYLVRGDLTDT